MFLIHLADRSMHSGRRLVLTLIAAAMCASMFLGLSSPPPANAAGPVTLTPGASTFFPTWLATSTKVCAKNLGSVKGSVKVDPWPYNDGILNRIYPPANGTSCLTAWWFGNLLKVTDAGHTKVTVYSV